MISSPDLRIDASFSPIPSSCVHRFLISSPDLGIDAKKPSRTAQRLHRFLISSPDLGIDARISPKTTFCVHRFLISGPNLGIDAAPSLRHRRIARLQRSRGMQAGTGCHEGGIILSKKPPEWQLSLLRQRPAPDSNFLCGNRKWFHLEQSSRHRRIARLQRSRGVQAGTGCHEGGIILSKKPPEWNLSLPRQRPASDSNFLCGNRKGSGVRT